ncbi:MAG: hypothetical protein IPM63_04450 [Acidobacteriota bacterium]|nr:MAG: hypothetical protein IPM63_04450 [Acidobacteriota bacterium]
MKVSRSSDPADPTISAAQTRWAIALSVSASAGFLSDIAGISLCAVSYLGVLPGSDLLNIAGTWLIVAGLPLIFFAAHCMDKIDSFGETERVLESGISGHKARA